MNKKSLLCLFLLPFASSCQKNNVEELSKNASFTYAMKVGESLQPIFRFNLEKENKDTYTFLSAATYLSMEGTRQYVTLSAVKSGGYTEVYVVYFDHDSHDYLSTYKFHIKVVD